MSRIVIGSADGKNVGFDLAELLTTRLLVQANSGGGKSWLLRRMAEQLWGKVQTIIIDPEGEFFTLREKFAYVLVGEGGETPADTRSAALLAQKFMELKVSAVCDLFESFRARPTERRRWVQDFLTALLEVPRSQWRPLVVIVDEAHKFCPQETPKAGDMNERKIISGCKDAMIALATTGRKRGFCPVWATQRLAKLDKDSSAELFNRLVGMTIEDVDVDRAADLMSVSREQKQEFRVSLRSLEPGQFYAFGRAISKTRVLLKVGPVQTRHPESGAAAKHSEPPPMPEAVAKLLPKLSDLPKEAADRARSEADLKREIRDLTQKVKIAERAAGAARATDATKATTPTDPRTMERLVKSATTPILRRLREVRDLAEKGLRFVGQAGDVLQQIVAIEVPVPPAAPASSSIPVAREISRAPMAPPGIAPGPGQTPASVDGISPAQMRIIHAAAQFHAVGIPSIEKQWLAARSGASHRSSSYGNNLGALRSRGLIDYVNGNVLLTAAGLELAGPHAEPLNAEEMAQSCRALLTPAQQRIFDALHHNYPNGIPREDLAAMAGASPTSSSFGNNLGALRSAGMIDYGPDKAVFMQKWIFLEAA